MVIAGQEAHAFVARSTASSLKTSSLSGGSAQMRCREMDQLRRVVTEQEDATLRLEATSKHNFSRQYEEYAHKQQTLFQEFDGAIKDKDAIVHALKQELANQKEQAFVELEPSRQDAECIANVSRPMFADDLSTQPYATPADKKTVHAIAAVAHALPVPAHSPGLSLGASAGNLNLRVHHT